MPTKDELEAENVELRAQVGCARSRKARASGLHQLLSAWASISRWADLYRRPKRQLGDALRLPGAPRR